MAHPMTDAALRAEFEAWWRGQGYDNVLHRMRRPHEEEYASSRAQFSWLAYRAGAARVGIPQDKLAIKIQKVINALLDDPIHDERCGAGVVSSGEISQCACSYSRRLDAATALGRIKASLYDAAREQPQQQNAEAYTSGAAVPQAARTETHPKTREQRLENALAFFASCIRSGEAWDDICQRSYDEAVKP